MTTKLVRDKIPDIMHAQKKRPSIRKCPDWAYDAYLTEKLIEEAHEVDDELNPDLLLLELADCFEVIRHIATLHDFTMYDVEKAADNKLEQYGGFREGWLLEDGLDEN